MSLKESIIENKGKITVGILGITAVAVLAFWLKKKFRHQQTPAEIPYPDEPVSKASISSDNSEQGSQQSIQGQQTYSQKFTRIINQCRAVLDSEGEIGSQAIKAIIRGQYQLANQDIKALIYKSRRQRRQKVQDALQYAKIVTLTQISLEQLQQKHLGAILSRFNIDKSQWKQACDTWQFNHQDGLSNLIQQEQKKQLLSLRIPNTKAKSYLSVEQILKFKINTLQILHPNDLGVDHTVDNATRYQLIETYINDLVLKKFNIQYQDVEYSIQQMRDQQKQKVIILQDQISEIMSKFIELDLKQKESDFY